jgi:hypothetical protein
MKNWTRVLLLISVLVMASVAGVNALPPGYSEYSTYGACYMTCYGEQTSCSVYYGTYEECCFGHHLCPDGNSPALSWSPDEGWPLFCPPYAD